MIPKKSCSTFKARAGLRKYPRLEVLGHCSVGQTTSVPVEPTVHYTPSIRVSNTLLPLALMAYRVGFPLKTDTELLNGLAKVAVPFVVALPIRFVSNFTRRFFRPVLLSSSRPSFRDRVHSTIPDSSLAVQTVLCVSASKKRRWLVLCFISDRDKDGMCRVTGGRW